LVRLPYVPVEELGHIVAEDRTYVAREMTALLTAWLTELPCQVVNRPSAACLAGPGWSADRWRHVARGLGIPVVSGRRRSSHPVAVVGGSPVGFAAGCAAAQLLAHAAAVDLLEVHFDQQMSVVGIDAWPDVSRPEVANALLERFGAT